MNRSKLDALWHEAEEQSRKEGVMYTRYHFAALVAAAEREACAVIAETPVSGEQDDITMQAKDRVAAAIRARKETT